MSGHYEEEMQSMPIQEIEVRNAEYVDEITNIDTHKNHHFTINHEEIPHQDGKEHFSHIDGIFKRRDSTASTSSSPSSSDN